MHIILRFDRNIHRSSLLVVNRRPIQHSPLIARHHLVLLLLLLLLLKQLLVHLHLLLLLLLINNLVLHLAIADLLWLLLDLLLCHHLKVLTVRCHLVHVVCHYWDLELLLLLCVHRVVLIQLRHRLLILELVRVSLPDCIMIGSGGLRWYLALELMAHGLHHVEAIGLGLGLVLHHVLGIALLSTLELEGKQQVLRNVPWAEVSASHTVLTLTLDIMLI